MPIGLRVVRVAVVAGFALMGISCSSSSGGDMRGSVAGAAPCASGKLGVTRPKPGGTSWTSDTYAITASTVDVSTTNGPSHYAVTFDGGSFDVTWNGPWAPSDPHAVTSVKPGTLSLPANDTYPATTWCLHDVTFSRFTDYMEIIFEAIPGACPTGTDPIPPTTEIDACVQPLP
jgi:hypothetical protein